MEIRPFTDNAVGSERSVLLLLLILEGLYRNPIQFDSVDEYNLFFKIVEDHLEDVGSIDNAVVMEVNDDGSLEIRLAEEVLPENREVSSEVLEEYEKLV